MLLRAILFAALAMTALPVLGQEVNQSTFPRLAGVAFGSPHDYDNPERTTALAKFDVVILNVWEGWESGRSANMETVVRRIKAINPQAKVFLYIVNNEFEDTQTGAVADFWRKALDDNRWWLYESGEGGARVTSTWGPNFYILNNTQFSKRNSSGETFVEWFGRRAVDNFLVPSPSVDGVFLDNVFWKPRVNGDWNRDGRTDDQNAPEVQQWLRDGARRQVDVIRSRAPGRVVIGNIADWGDPEANLAGFEGMLEGGLIEGLVGYEWSVENWGGWSRMMAGYRKAMNATVGPKYAIFSQEGISATDYRAMRYGLGSALLDNGYYAYHKTYGPPYLWFDEFDVELGRALSGPVLTPWKQGVFRRDFQNGIVLVNPKGNGAVTVSVEQGFRRLNGAQDRSVNDGTAVSSVRLEDRDGIVLLRESARALPLPPSDLRVE